MSNFNKFIGMGRLTRDTECRYTAGGTAIAEISMAINRVWYDQAQQKKEDVTFIEATFFGKQAENLQKFTQKGDLLHIEGRLEMDTWDDKQTGQKRSKLKVMGEGFQLMPKGDGPKQERQAQQPARQSTPGRGPADPDDAELDDVPF